MMISFTKMQALGNDFMVIDATQYPLRLTPELIQCWADRHRGIGFDQLLLLETSKQNGADFFLRIFNADGSEVAQCGNGARCIAQFLHTKNLTQHNPMLVNTRAGFLELKLETDQSVTAKLGVPNFDPAKIPFITTQQATTYTLDLAGQKIQFAALSLGNPHCVITVPDISKAPVQQLGTQLTSHSAFPVEVNVGFMQIINRQQIRLRVYERGVGETLACGSGACAAVIAGHVQGLLDNVVHVELPGGTLQVSWQGQQTPVFLRGEAISVFEGNINYAA